MADLSSKIGVLALQACLSEVSATVKPGLVDRRSSGAHKDMDYHTFIKSSCALAPHFIMFAKIGSESFSCSKSAFFKRLKAQGLMAEKDMFAATGGINTHKGLIFSFGLICASAAKVYLERGKMEPEAVCDYIAELTCGLSQKAHDEAISKHSHTKGESLLLKSGITGARGEAENGYKTILSISLPVLSSLTAKGSQDIDSAYVHTLLHLYANVTDTNVLSRGGEAAAQFVKNSAMEQLEKGGAIQIGSRKQLEEMDDEFISRNISPGGCADLLAATILLNDLKYFTSI